MAALTAAQYNALTVQSPGIEKLGDDLPVDEPAVRARRLAIRQGRLIAVPRDEQVRILAKLRAEADIEAVADTLELSRDAQDRVGRAAAPNLECDGCEALNPVLNGSGVEFKYDALSDSYILTGAGLPGWTGTHVATGTAMTLSIIMMTITTVDGMCDNPGGGCEQLRSCVFSVTYWVYGAAPDPSFLPPIDFDSPNQPGSQTPTQPVDIEYEVGTGAVCSYYITETVTPGCGGSTNLALHADSFAPSAAGYTFQEDTGLPDLDMDLSCTACG